MYIYKCTKHQPSKTEDICTTGQPRNISIACQTTQVEVPRSLLFIRTTLDVELYMCKGAIYFHFSCFKIYITHIKKFGLVQFNMMPTHLCQ